MTTAKWMMAFFVFAISGTSKATPAVEYYHAGFNHYFITANPDEIIALDRGAFGGVWRRTGEAFEVSATQTGNLGAVCRFFSASFAPLSSHFYTALTSECGTVKTNADWTFEGVGFWVNLPSINGACSVGEKVYRLYNNGMGGAPNHRFTTSPTTRSTMISQGWVPEGFGEGVTFCSSPPVTLISGSNPNPNPYDPTTDPSVPPTPTGLTVAGAFTAMYLSWEGGYHNHDHTEIWRAPVDDRSRAIMVGTSTGNLYADTVGLASTYWYWVRFVSQANVTGPWNSTSGTVGHTAGW